MPKFEAVVRIFAEDNHRKVIDIAETWSSAGSAPIEIEAKDQEPVVLTRSGAAAPKSVSGGN